jgi:FkbM family methyltransferase
VQPASLGAAPEPGEWSPQSLRRPGIAPRTIIDAGAYTGTLPLYEAYPEAFFVLVEPLEECGEHLAAVLNRFDGVHLAVALGSAVGTVSINVEPRRASKSSILQRTALTATGDRTVPRRVPVTTLDSLLAERWMRPPFGLKIDTEGYELDVIRGGTAFLRDTQFVIAEVSLADRFEHGYRFAEFIGEMDALGFRAVEVISSAGRYADLLFVRADT